MQDTYLAYLGKEHFRDEIHERAWLVRVAINKSKNAWKKNKRTAPLESLSEHGVSYEDEGVLKEVLSLPPQYKVPIQLHYLEGYSVEEVAGMLSLSVSAVKMRLLRGRELLKISLGEEK